VYDAQTPLGISWRTTDLSCTDRGKQNMLKETILTVYQGHTNAVWAVAWSPDGKYIASGSDDCTVQVWDPMTGHRRCMYTEHDSDVRAIT
jgi:WD40 repeat protein